MIKHIYKIKFVMNREHNLSMAFYHAFKGMQNFFLRERNGKIQLFIACTIVAAAFAFEISPMEWVIVLFCIGLVLALEMINSAIEKLCDLVHRDFHPASYDQKIKRLRKNDLTLHIIYHFTCCSKIFIYR